MSDITYVVLVPPGGQISPFQGFSEHVLSGEFLTLIRAVCLLPHDTSEIFLDHASLLQQRQKASYKNIVLINSDIADLTLLNTLPGLLFIVTPKELLTNAFALCERLDRHHEILSTVTTAGAIDLQSKPLSPWMLDEIILSHLKRIFTGTSDWPPVRSPYSSFLNVHDRRSGVTIASELQALSHGYSLKPGKIIIPDNDNNNYYAAVRDILAEANSKIYSGTGIPEIVLYAPAIAAMHYDQKSSFWNGLLRKAKSPWHRTFVKNGLIRNPGYSGIQMDEAISESPYEDPVTGMILLTRQKELNATNTAVALLCSADGAFAIRLPNAVNLHWGALKDIESLHRRSDKKAARLLQDRFREYSESLITESRDLLQFVTDNTACKICSDAPLEWMYLGDLPLMISHEVSRLPMTTGNMLMQFAGIGPRVEIEASGLHDVLVIRSFKTGDILHDFFENAIKIFKLKDRLAISIVDVNSVEDVKTALNGFSGNIVVFDCHGHHDGKDGNGWLSIGKDKLNTWELAHIARVPPIVMLSACSTSAVTGSHASVANGFLRCGALSVVGTFLDVNAVKSSAFIARILFRIAVFLPAVRKMGLTHVSWRRFISTFLRMSYITDVLEFFENERMIEAEAARIVQTAASYRINSLDSDWYTATINDISNAANVPAEDLRRKIKEEHPLMETMLYCHHGRPDWIEVNLIPEAVEQG